MTPYISPFNKINRTHLSEVGGKNALPGKLFNKPQPLGIEVPDGFVIRVEGCRHFLSHNKISDTLSQLLKFLLNTVHKCYESSFNDRAIKYRINKGFEDMLAGFVRVGQERFLEFSQLAGRAGY